MNIKQRMLEIKAEMKQLRASIATAKDDELDGIDSKITELQTEYDKLAKRQKMIDAAKRAAMTEGDDEGDDDGDPADEDEDEDPAPQVRSMGAAGASAKQRAAAEQAKKRAAQAEAWKKHNRTVVLDASVIIPEHKSSNLQGFPFNQVSNILDAVNYLELPNGETYEEPFIVETGMADYTSQPNADGTGGEYHNVEVRWDQVQVKKTKITAYSEITKELEKTPAANYAGAVEGNITVSLKKKLAKEIVNGDGAEGHFVGIMSDAVKANTVVDFELGVINENTLDELILNYGGEEDIESKMALLLNKLTLLAFSRVRGSDKRKVYTINYENGTIDGIKFFTSGWVKDFDTASAGDAVMAYGDFDKYRVAVFSDIDTARSEHYKFRQGITAFRGDVFMGGNIMAYHAFSRVFKGASSVTKLTKKSV